MRFYYFLMAFLFAAAALGAEPKARELSFNEAPKKQLEKTPKALFLIKRAKIGSDVGEPQFYPGEAQLRTVINDPALQSTKNFQ